MARCSILQIWVFQLLEAKPREYGVEIYQWNLV